MLELAKHAVAALAVSGCVIVRSRFRVCCCSCAGFVRESVCTSQGMFIHGSSSPSGTSVEMSRH